MILLISTGSFDIALEKVILSNIIPGMYCRSYLLTERHGNVKNNKSSVYAKNAVKKYCGPTRICVAGYDLEFCFDFLPTEKEIKEGGGSK